MLLLLLLSMGWAFDGSNADGEEGRKGFGDVPSKLVIFLIGACCALAQCALYAWKEVRKHCSIYVNKYKTIIRSCLLQTEIDRVDGSGEFDTVPGKLALGLRLAATVAFVLCLRDTVVRETSQERVQSLMHFGAASLVRKRKRSGEAICSRCAKLQNQASVDRH